MRETPARTSLPTQPPYIERSNAAVLEQYPPEQIVPKLLAGAGLVPLDPERVLEAARELGRGDAPTDGRLALPDAGLQRSLVLRKPD